MKYREKLITILMEEARTNAVSTQCAMSSFEVGPETNDDPRWFLGGDTLPAFTHGEEGTLSHYRRKVECRTSLSFTEVIIDPEYESISICLDDHHHLSNERGITIDDHRFLFEIGYWIFIKTGCLQFLCLEYAEQGAQMPNQLELVY